MKRDYYEVLGVSKTSLDDEIRSAYRKLAMQYHPDRCPGDEDAAARFKEVQEAYDVLSDTEKRQQYDRYGHQGSFRQHGARNPHDIFNDFFHNFFHQNRTSPSARDLQLDLDIEFMEAALGSTRQVKFERNEPCAPCQGTGAKDGMSLEPCKLCGGAGKISQNHGFVRLQSTCHQCRGRGKVITSACESCRGEGCTRVPIELDVKIPEGAFHGMRLAVKGQGEMSHAGGSRGDLFLVLHVKKHPFFSREEEDLLCTVPINFSMAVRGGTVKVPGLGSVVIDLTVPPGVKSGTTLRVVQQGIVDVYYPTRRGDMLVTLEIQTPSEVGQDYLDLMDKLSELEGKYPHPKIVEFENVKA